MPIEYVTNPLLHFPDGAGGASVTLAGTDPGSSAWVEVIPSASVAYVLAGIDVSLWPSPHAFYDAYCQVRVGVGPAGSESIIATFPVMHFTADESHCDMLTSILIDLIPAGSRVTVQVARWNESTPTTPWNITLHLYAKPLSGTVTTTTQPLKVFPATPLPTINVASPGSFTNGSWVQVHASLPAAIVLCGYQYFTNANGVSGFLDIGVGGAGAEVEKTTVPSKQSSQTGSLLYVALPRPLDAFPAASRLAVRQRASGASTANVSLSYFEKPL